MKQRRMALVGAGLLVVSTVAWGGIYRWVDSAGQVHYGERPPQAANSEEVQVKPGPPPDPAAAERRAKQQKYMRAFEEEHQVQASDRQKSKKKEAQRQRNCAQARDRLRSYQRSNRVYRVDAQGNRVILPDSSREKAIKQAREAIQRWCD